MSKSRQILGLAVAVAGMAWMSAAVSAATVVVNSFAASNATPGVWGVSDSRTGTTGSTASVVGNAPAGDPVGPGAAVITTDGTTASIGEVGVTGNYGTASSILNSINVAYSYYKQAGSGNAETAPSIKLTFLNSTYAATPGNDGFVTLVYEPYWNIVTGVSEPVPTDTWRTDTIDANTGVFWQTGGFGQANSGGGPPLETLSQWVASFNSTSGGAFSNASLIGVEVGIGSNTPNQVGYFDNVTINGTALANTTYNFETVAVPLPSAASMGLVVLGLVGAAGLLRKKLQTA